MLSYRIVYPRGDRSKLAVAQVLDYEADEWALASRREFDTEEEATEYMRELAEQHGLEYEGMDHRYLD